MDKAFIFGAQAETSEGAATPTTHAALTSCWDIFSSTRQPNSNNNKEQQGEAWQPFEVQLKIFRGQILAWKLCQTR